LSFKANRGYNKGQMWPFKRSQVSPAQVHELDKRLRQVEEDLGALQMAHERLRGRFYATKGAEFAAKPAETKAEILKRFGKL
jgi:hypothetical protein